MVYIGIENYHAGNHAKKVFMVSVEIQKNVIIIIFLLIKAFRIRNVFVTPNIRNMKYKIIIGLSAILYFTGCYNREQTPRLSEAEKLMQNNPDSALAILQKLKPEGNRAEQARYALLYSEALEKNK